jgi:hypothetical protein
MDACLSHSNAGGVGHYHSWSPCITKAGAVAVTGGQTVAPGLCTSNTACISSFSTFSLAKGYTSKALSYIALAKDGHMIVGPYNEKGELWTCDDVDMCNGVFLSNGSYVYASTTFFPYVLGCFGPAQDHSYKAKCSTSACSGSSLSVSKVSSTAGGSLYLEVAAVTTALIATLMF